MQECSQCGNLHPPLKPNQVCPMAPQKDSKGNEIDCGDFLRQMKDITVSQLQSKEIKDHKKLFGNIIVEVTKFFENYKE